MHRPAELGGFTLIELSIVLVIIGLIVGGVLVGQDLIRAAGVRATISQIEKYQTAVNTFLEKYGALPGDIPAVQVAKFGFTVTPTRSGTQARGDGNGLIEGICYQCGGGTVYGWDQQGETALFWEDLSANSNLIEGSFTTATDGATSDPACSGAAACTDQQNWTPPAKLGNGNYVYVYSDDGGNYFGLGGMGTNIYGNNALESVPYSSMKLTALQAYSIDQKVDDGLPQAGNVQAVGVGYAGVVSAPDWYGTCFYTPGGSSIPVYGISYNSGSGQSCILSFAFE